MKFSPHFSIQALCFGFLVAGCHPAASQQPTASTLKSGQPYLWRNVEIEGGGFVPGLVFHPKAQGVLYSRTDIGGAYRFDPATKRWVPLIDHIGSKDWNFYGIESIALDPTDANRVYLAVGTYPNEWAGNGGMLRSTDQGKTWQRTDLPFKNGGNWGGRSMGERLVVDPRNPQTLFFGSRNNGLWKSGDYGATWQNVASFPQGTAGDKETKDIGIPLVMFGPDNAIYAALADRKANLYRSTDAGKTWQELPNHPRGFLPHHAEFDAAGTLYLTYGDNPGPNGMTDGAVWKRNGQSGVWTDITPLRPNVNGESGFGYAGLAVDKARPGTLMVATMDRWGKGDDIFRSTDGGATWKSVRDNSIMDAATTGFLKRAEGQAGFGHWIGDVEIDPFNPNRALYVTGATIWGTDNLLAVDAGQKALWKPRAQGLEETAAIELISPPVGAPLHSALGDISGFRHDDLSVSPDGPSRRELGFGSSPSIDFAEQNPQLMVLSGDSWGQQRKRAAFSTDGGTTWTPIAGQPAGMTGAGKIRISADGKTIAWSPDGATPSISRDNGATWTAVAGLASGTEMVPDRQNPALFYAFDKTNGTLLASTDGGARFTARATGLPADSRLRAVAGRAGDLWLASRGEGLRHSTDGGQTFVKVASVQTAFGIGFGKAAPNRAYPALYLSGTVGDVEGVFRSDDAGQNWVRINDDAHQYGFHGSAITGDPRIYGRVYIGTNGRGIFYADPMPAR